MVIVIRRRRLSEISSYLDFCLFRLFFEFFGFEIEFCFFFLVLVVGMRCVGGVGWFYFVYFKEGFFFIL